MKVSYELRNFLIFRGALRLKTISLLNHGGEGQGTAVALFEGFMDFLSALVYTQKKYHRCRLAPLLCAIGRLPQFRNRISLKFISTLITTRPVEIDGVVFQEQLPDRVVTDQSELYAGHKDFNDWLMARAPSVGIRR